MKYTGVDVVCSRLHARTVASNKSNVVPSLSREMHAIHTAAG